MHIPGRWPAGRPPNPRLVAAGLVFVVLGAGMGVLAFTSRSEPSATPSAAAGPTPTNPAPPVTTTSRKPEEPAPSSKPASGSTPQATPTTSPAQPATPQAQGTKPQTQRTAPKPKADPVTSSPFLIRNQSTGRCIDLPMSGPAQVDAVLFQWECTPGDSENQQYERLPVGKQFMLSNVKSQLCINVYGSGAAPVGSAISVSQCVAGASDNAMFRSKARGNGQQIIHAKSDLCLDLTAEDPEGETDNGRNLTLADCGSAATQIWAFQ